jgi:hypothetical protein
VRIAGEHRGEICPAVWSCRVTRRQAVSQLKVVVTVEVTWVTTRTSESYVTVSRVAPFDLDTLSTTEAANRPIPAV